MLAGAEPVCWIDAPAGGYAAAWTGTRSDAEIHATADDATGAGTACDRICQNKTYYFGSIREDDIA